MDCCLVLNKPPATYFDFSDSLTFKNVNFTITLVFAQMPPAVRMLLLRLGANLQALRQ